MFKSLVLLTTLLLFISCNRTRTNRVIVIQPFGNFPHSLSIAVLSQLKEINSNTIIRQNIQLPKLAFFAPRNRYRADSLIKFLSCAGNTDTVIIGVTETDISTSKDNIPDWGVMGLGYCPGNACIVSTFRLSKKDLAQQFYKVAIHELGHTQGLPHCKNKNCYMRDAEGGNHLNEEINFCKNCKAILRQKGWQLR